MKRLGVFLLAVALPGGSALAQQPDSPEDFGTQDEAITVVGYEEFFPISSLASYGSENAFGSRWETEVGPGLSAPMNMLPNGSLLTQIVFYVSDDAPNDDVQTYLCRYWVDSATGDNPNQDCPISLTTSGTPGDTHLDDFPDLPILYRQDIDGDGTMETVHYGLSVQTPPYNGMTRLHMVRLRWRRQVSPAPQTASFNDVPTSDQAFQFIEALAASGITVGCSTNPPLYCPDAPLTRRQMAVFLAKALGLHWPWNAQ